MKAEDIRHAGRVPRRIPELLGGLVIVFLLVMGIAIIMIYHAGETLARAVYRRRHHSFDAKKRAGR